MHVIRGGLFAMCVYVAGCGSSDENATTSPITLQDTGRICLYDAPIGQQNFEAGRSIQIVYRLESECLSSSCTQLTVSCSINRTATTEALHSLASWTVFQPENPDGICTDDCRVPTAYCETEALEAGDHIFVFGDVQRTLTIPSQLDSPFCLEGE